MTEFKPKHSISDAKKFQEGREKIGGLILEGMKATGGTDIDWVIEHRGGFIVLENKEFQNDLISIPWGKMIAFEQLYKKLNSDGRCHFLIVGYDDIDFSDPKSIVWFFDMEFWKMGTVRYTKSQKYKRYFIEREAMTPMSLNDFRYLIEKYWTDFENS